MKKNNLLIQAFDEPNHTQTPNKLFDIMPEMSEAELRVTMVMVRHTLGYHKDTFKMSVQKLADAAGLSRQGALNGTQAAEQRGIFRRSNPDSQTEAEWEMVLLPLNVVDPSTKLIPPLNLVEVTPQPSGGQSRVKENLKKEKKGDLLDGMLYYGKQAVEQGMNEVEEILVKLERGLRVNITRSTNNQAVARRILKDGRPLDTWLSWVMADEWRVSHLYIYADLEKVWRDYPQAFDNSIGFNPQGLSIT